MLPKCDVVYLLRMQRERQTEALLPSLREYTARYGLTQRRADLLDADAIVMHPGPMNRGVEISAEVADLPRSVIIDQVRNGVAVRMAILYWLLGSGMSTSSLSLVDVAADGSWTRPASAAPTSSSTTGASSRSGADLTGDQVLDAGGCVVAPGLVDLHAHLREPGHEEAETVETGSRAAALGGFTAVVAMPNTEPAIDSAGVVREVLELGRRAGLCDVRAAGAITVGRKGEQLAPLGEMADLGVRLFTDDGRGVQDNRLMRRALEYASGLGVTLAQHCEDEALAAGGHMNEGEWSSKLGIPGQPGRGRGADGDARHHAGAAHRRPGPLPTPVDGGLAGAGAQRES